MIDEITYGVPFLFQATYYVPPKYGTNTSDHAKGKLADKFRNSQTKENNTRLSGIPATKSMATPAKKVVMLNLNAIKAKRK